MRATYEREFEAIYTGRGEFYSGIQPGDEVLVREHVTTYSFEGRLHSSVRLHAQSLRRPGAWLSLFDDPTLLAERA